MKSSSRILGLSLSVLIALGLLAPMVVLAEGVAEAEDSFEGPTYSGGSGWSGDWVETGESGGPGPASGAVRVVGGGNCNLTNCIRITAGIGADLGLFREVDMSGASSGTVAFTFRRIAFLLAVGTMRVQSRASSADTWLDIGSYSLLVSDGSHQSADLDIPSTDISDTTQIRFVVDAVSASSQVYIDNVAITATYPATTTTTTTTTTTLLPPTTSLPITTTTIDLPVTTTTITLPTSTSSTTTSSTTTTTLADGSTTTSSTTVPTPDETKPPGDVDPGDPPPEIPRIPIDPLSPEEVEFAGENNIAIDLADGSDFQSFGIGINPLTDLGVGLRSSVETISSGIVSALLLGGAIAFFAVRRIKDEDEEAPTPQPKA